MNKRIKIKVEIVLKEVIWKIGRRKKYYYI